MFAVEITADAKAVLEAKFRESGLSRAGVMIVRQARTADVSRSKEGKTVWSIEPPESPWALHTGSFETYRDDELQVVNGIRVYLALIPRENEKGVIIALKDGEPTVETLGA
jgi:hypothetical protein